MPLPELDACLAVLQEHSGPQLEQEIFTPAELRMLLKAASLQDRTAILIALNCAVGNSDMGKLKWGDFVTRQVAGKTEHVYEQARGKTGRKRRAPLWVLTVEYLDKWRQARKARGLSTGPKHLVFTTRDGTPLAHAGANDDAETWRHDALSKRLDKLLKNLGIKRPRLSWYSLRHTAATWATDYAEDDRLVDEGNQFLLGQASGKMWKRYSRGIPPAIRKAVQAIWRGLNDGEELVLA